MCYSVVWLRFSVLAVLLVAVHALPEELRAKGIYLADAPERGEAFRWFFAHFIHRSWLHLGFNLGTGALAAWMLAPVFANDNRWGWELGLLGVGLSASLACLQPDAPPFVGLSALIYAWLVAGAIRGLALRRLWGVYASLLTLLFVKAGLELALARDMGGATLVHLGPSAVEAHRHAMFWGLLWGGIGLTRGRAGRVLGGGGELPRVGLARRTQRPA